MADIAVIFDLDGVLIQSGDLHMDAWVEFARQHSLPHGREYFWQTFGKRNRDIIPEMFGERMSQILIDEKSEYKESLFRKIAVGKLHEVPGATQLIRELKDADISMAIGSSTPGSNMRFFLQEMPFLQNIRGYICGDDVGKGKPDPEVFFKAGAINSLPPERQVVFEDAIAGVTAAKAGGFKCIGIATSESPAALVSAGADIVIATPSEATIAMLRLLVFGAISLI